MCVCVCVWLGNAHKPRHDSVESKCEMVRAFRKFYCEKVFKVESLENITKYLWERVWTRNFFFFWL
jgi:hypothetical protein